MKNILKTILPLSALALALCACVGISIERPKDFTKYYALPAAQTAKIEGLQNIKVNVFQVRVPAYMSRPQIIQAKENSAEILIADSDLWAEPIEDALTRAAIADISAITSSQNIQQPVLASTDKDAVNLKIDILKCIGSIGGKLEFKAQYTLSNSQFSKSFIFETSANAGENFDAYVHAISKALEELCADICKKIQN
ncbi:MAG: membrane integrity-associated transporter subunit PqiC [Opitutales bacterium]|nr:membrane integrity-associated transporter subunit PqiC [Opitutales bacterium]